MKKILFATDLDNTLIHSRRKKTETDICVEIYQEQEQSFLSEQAEKLFCQMIQQENITFLPVTTRTIAQYQRIIFPENYRPEFALTANGLIFLHHDFPEPEWLAESQNKIKPYQPELCRWEKIFRTDSRFRHVQIADGMFLACACETPEIADNCFSEYSPEKLTAFRTGRKLYFLPPEEDKGTALKRFLAKHDFDFVIAAGDSEMDIPMLNAADKGLFRENQEDFSAYMLTEVLQAAR